MLAHVGSSLSGRWWSTGNSVLQGHRAGSAMPSPRASPASAAAGSPPDTCGRGGTAPGNAGRRRSEEHTSELQSLMRISYAVFCLKKKKIKEPSGTSKTVEYYI